MHLSTPDSAILSAVIFNALIIIALVPLALRGVRYRPSSAPTMLRRNLLIYGLGGLIAPFIGIKTHRPHHPVHPRNRGLMYMYSFPVFVSRHMSALRMLLVLTAIFVLIYPVVMNDIAQVAFH